MWQVAVTEDVVVYHSFDMTNIGLKISIALCNEILSDQIRYCACSLKFATCSEELMVASIKTYSDTWYCGVKSASSPSRRALCMAHNDALGSIEET